MALSGVGVLRLLSYLLLFGTAATARALASSWCGSISIHFRCYTNLRTGLDWLDGVLFFLWSFIVTYAFITTIVYCARACLRRKSSVGLLHIETILNVVLGIATAVFLGIATHRWQTELVSIRKIIPDDETRSLVVFITSWATVALLFLLVVVATAKDFRTKKESKRENTKEVDLEVGGYQTEPAPPQEYRQGGWRDAAVDTSPVQ
mmetsp:Transcript_48553/g.118817  ORF Transcript_48553/g.118817 Transcript_48553/m.118817 type:complete len:206 (-) Transcript_48553:268-885(-)